MNNIKEINGKHYMECDVVMLTTDQRSCLFINKRNNQLQYWFKGDSPNNAKHQHLYFLSNEEIKGKDWFYDTRDRIISNNSLSQKMFSKKIIATTNNNISINLGLEKYVAPTNSNNDLIYTRLCPFPQPSKEFIQAYIEAYNSSKPITKVLVEYKEVQTACSHNIPTQDINQLEDCWELVLKVNSSNEITIKKVKDS
jgi:hypothetical protein